MSPRDFLAEECRSVAETLKETLRHDYGPERSETYFLECRLRLGVVEQALREEPRMDRETIAAHMQALSALGSRISFIERAHLGEFSWPFSSIVEDVAGRLFPEETLDDELQPVELPPIVHVVAEGADYQIVDDDAASAGERHIIIVAFPRQLKHLVLLHSIFGHELGHIAVKATRTGCEMAIALERAREGRLLDERRATAWLRRPDAPETVRLGLEADTAFRFDEQSLVNWRHEIVCDLFGLRLFGPAFAAAHRSIIEALCPKEDHFELGSTTHPPYPVRQRILATAIDLLGWTNPASDPADEHLHDAELALIAYVSEAIDDPWFAALSREEVAAVLDAVERVLEPHGLAYSPPEAALLRELTGRLGQERPPIFQSVDEAGVPTNLEVRGAHCLYAGWTYWFGRSRLADDAKAADDRVEELTFLELNRLCDQALLQQRAIDMTNRSPAPSAGTS